MKVGYLIVDLSRERNSGNYVIFHNNLAKKKMSIFMIDQYLFFVQFICALKV